TVNRCSTSFVSPSIVHVVDTHVRVAPPGDTVTRYSVIGSPLATGASHARTTARSRTWSTRGTPGAAGRPRTVSRMRPSTWRSGSRVTSCTRYRTTSVPMNPARGRTDTSVPSTPVSPSPLSTTAETTLSGSPGKGLDASRSTATVVARPSTPPGITWSTTRASARELATTPHSAWTGSGTRPPYSISIATPPTVPRGVDGPAATVRTVPSRRTSKPGGTALVIRYLYCVVPVGVA